MATDARSAGQDGGEIDILALLNRLWVGKLWIIASVLGALFIGAFHVLSQKPIYQADALIQLEARSGALALPDGMADLLGSDASGAGGTETEIEIIKSRMVIGEAVQELALDLVAEPVEAPILGQLPKRLGLPQTSIWFMQRYEWGGEAIELAQLDLPEDLLGIDLFLTKTGPQSYLLELPGGRAAEGKVGEILTLPDLGASIMITRLEGADGRQFRIQRKPFEAAVRDVQLNFSVKTAARNALILRLGYLSTHRRMAERVLDAISRAYVSQNIARSAAEADNSLTFIEEQLPIAEAAMKEAQQKLNDFRKANQSVDLDYETQNLLEEATRIEAELNALSMQEDELKKRFTINHPTYQALLEGRETLERRLEKTRGLTADLPETQKDIFNFTRDLEVAQQVYGQLLNRAQELRVVRASTVGSVRVVDTAYANVQKVAPKTGRILALAVAVGMILGAGFIALRHMLYRGIRGSEEIEQLGLPVFGTVSFSPEAAAHNKRKGDLPILALTKPDDLVIEALRSMRTALHFGMLDAKTNSVLLTSAAPGAGKSFTAANLAVVAAQSGQKVCLIDADLRRGYLRRYFGKAKNTPGLAEFLASEKSLEEVLHQGPVPSLSVITSGRYPPNPSELLMRAEFAALLKRLNQDYGLILIDAPPTLAVTDPVVIGRYAGATIVVVRHLETMPGELEAVKRIFETAGGKITGAMLNGYRQDRSGRYGGTYGYYNYRYSYQREQN